MKNAAFAATLLLAACASAPASSTQVPACPPAGYDRAALEALRAAEFQIADTAEHERFARDLIPCLASPDPFLRDRIAYEGLTTMLRGEQLSVATRTNLTNEALAMMRGPDPDGFARPFAALALSELVRADRINGYFDDAMYDEIVAQSSAYMRGISDYRGFDEREGWRHGVAHGADLLMQIVLDPNFNAPSHMRAIRDAVGAQVAPTTHFYTYGESERLMRPILFMARRGAFTEAEWTAWFEQLMQPAPLNAWSDAFGSQAGLAKRHNMTAFIQAIWINARLSENTADDVLLPGAEAALRALP
jgi:hypothetical protein